MCSHLFATVALARNVHGGDSCPSADRRAFPDSHAHRFARIALTAHSLRQRRGAPPLISTLSLEVWPSANGWAGVRSYHVACVRGMGQAGHSSYKPDVMSQWELGHAASIGFGSEAHRYLCAGAACWQSPLVASTFLSQSGCVHTPSTSSLPPPSPATRQPTISLHGAILGGMGGGDQSQAPGEPRGGFDTYGELLHFVGLVLRGVV